MICHYVYDKKAGRVLIPGCWGTVHSNDMSDCYCDRSRAKKRQKIMRITVVANETRKFLLELPKDYDIPNKDNLLHFKTDSKSKVNIYQVINVDFYYERQMIEIRVVKL
jgi:hypothetical protein